MGKPRMLGMTKTYNPKLWRGAKDRRLNRPRPREKNPTMAGRTAKSKEATA